MKTRCSIVIVLGVLAAAPLCGEMPPGGGMRGRSGERQTSGRASQGIAIDYIRELLTFEKELGLSAPQVEAIKQVRSDAVGEMAKEREALQASQKALSDSLNKPKPDFDGARAASREMTGSVMQLQIAISVDAYEKAYAVLTDKQKGTLSALRARRNARSQDEILYGKPGMNE